MRKPVFLLLVFSCFAASSHQAGNEAVYQLNINDSYLFWECADKFGASHEGTLKFISGNITLKPDGSSIKGDFIIDMNSIKNTDVNPEKSRKELEDHLKSDDFFAVSTYPKASFNVTSVTPTKLDEVMINGLLMIKGRINAIKFPAVIKKSKDTITSKGAVIIDRTKWEITFRSETFFGSLKDAAISDDIKINLNLVFNK